MRINKKNVESHKTIFTHYNTWYQAVTGHPPNPGQQQERNTWTHLHSSKTKKYIQITFRIICTIPVWMYDIYCIYSPDLLPYHTCTWCPNHSVLRDYPTIRTERNTTGTYEWSRNTMHSLESLSSTYLISWLSKVFECCQVISLHNTTLFWVHLKPIQSIDTKQNKTSTTRSLHGSFGN